MEEETALRSSEEIEREAQKFQVLIFADILRALREHPDWLEEVRRIILSHDLIELPRKFEEFLKEFHELKEDFRELKRDTMSCRRAWHFSGEDKRLLTIIQPAGVVKIFTMIKIYASSSFGFTEHSVDEFGAISKEKILWIDVEKPTEEEILWLRSAVSFEMPPREVFGDIEISSKYKEEGERIFMSLSFVIQQKEDILVEPVFFFLKGRYMVTIRYRDIPTLMIFQKRVESQVLTFQFAEEMFSHIVNIEVDRIGDRLEILGRRIRNLRKEVFEEQTEEIIKDISYYDELNITLRETINEKLRILSHFVKSPRINAQTKREIKVILDDLHTLLDYTTFYMDKIDSIQNTLLGLINIRQNEAVKVFTVLATIFLPATLIASIYGMNFEHMPELHWKYGYVYSLALMVVITLSLIFWVRRKGWL
ncbi:magnesium/cobalt transporter CorA [Thermocrinis sp.]